MKYQKLVNELNNLLGSATRRSQKHQDKLDLYLGQFKAEEQKLRRKLEKADNKTSRGQLKKELGAVKEAYAILGAYS